MNMTRTFWIIPLAFTLTGCVTTAEFKDQVSKTEAQKKRADDTQAQLDAANRNLDAANKSISDQKAALAAAQGDAQKKQSELEGKIKADDTQIAALQKSIKDLTTNLNASRNDLKLHISELVKEKDTLTQQLSDLTKSTSDQVADLTRKLAQAVADAAQAQAAKDALQKQKDDELAKAQKSMDDIKSSLKAEIDKGSLQISELKGKLTLNLVDKVLFATGEADVNPEGRKVLDQIGSVLNNVQGKDIHIDGHTDNVPITGGLAHKYATNWELSTARATAVARYLQDNGGVDPKRLVAAGFGEYRPIAPNDTPENRALNRRIEIVLVPHD